MFTLLFRNCLRKIDFGTVRAWYEMMKILDN